MIGGTKVDDTFAEAFSMRYTRIIVTAVDPYWVDVAMRELTGYGSSVIGCDAEAGIEQQHAADSTPDGRPGASALLFAPSADALAKAVTNRAGQCVMTCATTALYDGLGDATDRIPLGKHLRFFGDGYQKSKVIDGRRYWRVPVMDGEFLMEETIGVAKGIGGGCLIFQGETAAGTLLAARRAVDALANVHGVILPFPGGLVRSGSKVGSVYRGLRASTNEAFCPTLRGRVQTQLDPRAQCAYEMVLDGTDESAIAHGMAVAIAAAAGPELVMITSANFGGKLGKYKFRLHELVAT